MKRWLVVLLLAACIDREGREKDALLLAGDATHGAEVFASTCRRCHAGPSDAGECWANRAMVVSAAVYGWKLGAMPAQDQLSEQEVADVASFLSVGCGRRVDAGVDAGVDVGVDAGP